MRRQSQGTHVLRGGAEPTRCLEHFGCDDMRDMNVGMNQRRRRSIETDLSISNGVPLLTSSTGLNSCASLIYVCVCV